jgi:cytochrome c oxidase assembly factor CtaG
MPLRWVLVGVWVGRVWCFLELGLGVWVLATMSFVGVYADTLFWVRALQVLMLLLVVPFGLALGKPVTVLRDGGGISRRRWVDAALASRAARVATNPAVTSIAMLSTDSDAPGVRRRAPIMRCRPNCCATATRASRR